MQHPKPTSVVPPRMSLNLATVRHASLAAAVDAALAASIPALGLWREPVTDMGLARAAKLLSDTGVRASSLCRGGFFTEPEGPARRRAMDENRRAIEEAATLRAPVLVLLVGRLPAGSRDIEGARARVSDAIGELVDDARAAGVTLAIEPLHPMFASDRCVVSTLGQALDLAEQFDPSVVGVLVDTYHVWWDPALEKEISRAGDRILGYQISDWAMPIGPDPLLARRWPGEGVIDFQRIGEAVDNAGYRGFIEIEIFNQEVWDAPLADVVARSITASSVAHGLSIA